MFEILSRSLGALFELAYVAIPALIIFVSIAALIRTVTGKTAFTISIPNDTYKILKKEASRVGISYKRLAVLILRASCDATLRKQLTEPPTPPI